MNTIIVIKKKKSRGKIPLIHATNKCHQVTVYIVTFKSVGF